MLVLFPLKMSTCVGPATAANIYTCCSGFYCNCLHVLVLSLLRKCLHMLVRFLLQMSACAGSVTTANVKNCWSCSFCLHVMVRFLLQMSACVGPIPVENVFMSLSVPTANVCLCWSYTYCKCSCRKYLHVLVSSCCKCEMSTHVCPVPISNVYM